MSVQVYLPPQVATDPVGVADDFSENIINSLGRWYASKCTSDPCDPSSCDGNISITLDGTMSVVRNSALRISRTGVPLFMGCTSATTDSAFFTFDTPVNLTNLDYLSFAWLAYDHKNDSPLNILAPNSLVGYSVVSLSDINGNSVYTPLFSHSTNLRDKTAYVQKSFFKIDFSGENFNWAKVKTITFYIGLQRGAWGWDASGYSVWIDAGPFMKLTQPLNMFTINAENTAGTPITFGKNANITDPLGYTDPIPIPFGPWGFDTAGEYTIIILDDDFIKWKDTGSTSKTRVFSLGEESVTATAVFAGGGGGGGDNLGIIVAVGGLTIVGIGAYYLTKKKRGS